MIKNLGDLFYKGVKERHIKRDCLNNNREFLEALDLLLRRYIVFHDVKEYVHDMLEEGRVDDLRLHVKQSYPKKKFLWR